MRMRNLLIVVASLCVASVAMADLTRVNVVMDISDPDNVTLTNYEENGTYGGAYFAIDGLEFSGAVAELSLVGPRPCVYDPPGFGLGITIADGHTIGMITTDTVWMVYGESYNLGSIVISSDPGDFYGEDGTDIYPRSFIVVDATDNNGLGGGKFLGTIIPEPASMSLLAFGALAILRRRRS